MSAELEFYAFDRQPLLGLAESREGGRLRGELHLTITDASSAATRQGSAPFLFYSGKDVAALRPAAIRLVAPKPNVGDAETTKLVHVDFAEPDLPWRYPSFVPSDNERRPWLVVVVGPSDQVSIGAGSGTFPKTVLALHPLGRSALWAHVQQADGVSISRVYSPYPLAPLTAYTAAIVPAFDRNGDPSWAADGALADPTRPLPVFHTWRFATAEEGDFETLAARLQVRRAGDIGKARIHYRREVSDIDVNLDVGGAITSLQPPLAELDPANMDDASISNALLDVPELLDGVDPEALTPDQRRATLIGLHEAALAAIASARADLDALSDDVTDTYASDEALRREIVELPSYGRPWAHDPEAMVWGNTLNDDPRYRGIAGLGLWLGILAQEQLMAAAVQQAGALGTVRQRVGDLALGQVSAASLWRRLLPDDPARRLRVFGPALGRMMSTAGGSVLSSVTGERTHLDGAVFSSAAQRILRDGTGPARHVAERGIDRAEALTAANAGPRDAVHAPPGLPHVESLANELEGTTFDDLIGATPMPDGVFETVHEFVGAPLDQDDVIARFVSRLSERTGTNACDDHVTIALQAAVERGVRIATCEVLLAAVQYCHLANGRVGDVVPDFVREVTVFVSGLLAPPCGPHRAPVDLGGLAGAVAGAVDPTQECPPASRRLDSTIEGLHVCPPRPPELPVRLDFPTWTLLNEHAKEWLLPGAGTLENHSIVALQTNPVFIDAYMVGINTQFMNEMRWRSLAVDRSITPLRMFWGQMNYRTGAGTPARGPDIQPIGDWAGAPDADLGDLSHQVIKPGDLTGRRDLIILFRTPLFRRYPSTVVYLVNKEAGTPAAIETVLRDTPLFTHEPAPDRSRRTFYGPIFRGALAPDLHFFAFDVDPGTLDHYWLVLDEPPAELRFRVDRPDGADSAATAKARIDHPTRVAIDGHELELLASQ